MIGEPFHNGLESPKRYGFLGGRLVSDHCPLPKVCVGVVHPAKQVPVALKECLFLN